MNRSSFGQLMKGEKTMYGKKKPMGMKKKPMTMAKEKANGKKKTNDKEERVLMSEERKDVTVKVSGVSMSGGVRNDSNRSTPEDKKESKGETARDS